MSNFHASYIRRCLELAKKGLGMTSPNPMVGALLVKDNKVIGEGFHFKKGEAHAEVNAINSSVLSVEGATLYCSLEPCCHRNKLTPPCTDLIIEKKIARVIVATLDPNPEVAGKGLKELEKHGIKTSYGYCVEDAEELNKVFFKSVRNSLPYIHLKIATTLDGRIATSEGDSKWISCEESRNLVHSYRRQYDAVMVGRNTLNLDDPKLTARDGEKVVKTPKAVVIGNPAQFKKDCYLLKNPENLYVLSTGEADSSSNMFNLNEGEGLVSGMLWLKKEGIQSILVEGGSQLASTILEQNLFDELTLFICPKVIGNGPAFFNSSRSKLMAKAIQLEGEQSRVGKDIVFKVRKNVYRTS